MNEDPDIKDCSALMCGHLPALRNILKLTQEKTAVLCGTSRVKIIQYEHKVSKVTKAVLVALITYFSMRPKTAQYLRTVGLYNNKFVRSFGFREEIIAAVIDRNINGDAP
ncbi:MAG: helix-turn-helix domain-containing protein [Spirochaetaceae bacterium]|nr:helix-turn-helix domain-containing protein [Spirochaetaceae bacterium]